MKIHLKIFFFALIYTFQSFGQITVTAPSEVNYLGAGPYYPIASLANTPFVADAGTQSYRFSFNAGGLGSNLMMYKCIFRQDGIWKDGTYLSNDISTGTINLVTVEACNSPNPPCGTYWKTPNNGNQYWITITGTSCETATCMPQLVPEITPDYIKLPLKDTQTLAQITNPKTGMMVYDVIENCFKIYRNGTWDCIELSKNKGIVPTGTTAQRPTSPVIGMIRYNTETQRYEGYRATGWVDLHTN